MLAITEVTLRRLNRCSPLRPALNAITTFGAGMTTRRSKSSSIASLRLREGKLTARTRRLGRASPGGRLRRLRQALPSGGVVEVARRTHFSRYMVDLHIPSPLRSPPMSSRASPHYTWWKARCAHAYRRSPQLPRSPGHATALNGKRSS